MNKIRARVARVRALLSDIDAMPEASPVLAETRSGVTGPHGALSCFTCGCRTAVEWAAPVPLPHGSIPRQTRRVLPTGALVPRCARCALLWATIPAPVGREHREAVLDALLSDHLGVPVAVNLARAVTGGGHCGLAIHQPDYLADNTDRGPLWWIGDREDARRRAQAPYTGPGSLGGKLDIDLTGGEDRGIRLILDGLRTGPVAVLEHYAKTLNVDLLNLTPQQREDLETACRRGILTRYYRGEPQFQWLSRKQLSQGLAWLAYERDHGKVSDPMKLPNLTRGLLAIARMRGDAPWL